MNESQGPGSNAGNMELERELASGLRDGKFESIFEFLEHKSHDLPAGQIAGLVRVEIEFRRSQGEPAEFVDYVHKFPELATISNDLTLTRPFEPATADQTEFVEIDTTPPTRNLIEVGDKLDDFDLVAQLGKGSFAVVFLARQVSMQRMVALKVSEDHGMEAQTLAQLDHPNIVRVFDQRKAKDHELQLLYMQYLEGGTLLDVLKKLMDTPKEELDGKAFVKCVDEAVVERGATPLHESVGRQAYLESNWEQTICRIGHSLTKALDYAHQKGVLHRDIKPANVLIGSDCSVKLADFNISSADTVIGDFKFGGSLAYMPPEQIRAFSREDDFNPEQLDSRCDIYSLGVMLYQLLRRELPFYAMSKSRSAGGLDNMIAEREHSLTRISSSLKEHSPLMRKALTRCLQPDVNKRPESARELANQLGIGLDPQAEDFLFPRRRDWALFFQKQFLVVCVGVSLLFNILAACFVYRFNLMDSVPEAAHGTFRIVQFVINGISFPLAIGLFVYMTYAVQSALRHCLRGEDAKIPDSQFAIHRALSAGHIQAVICAAIWIVAGLMYPTVLTVLGCSLSQSDWIDFVASHTLAGISITSLTYFATTYLTLRIWLPVLIQNSFSENVISTVTSGLVALIRKIPIYQLLAVSVPLLAIALLVIFGDIMTGGKFPLIVLSLFGLLTIPIVLFGGNRVRAICDKLLYVFRRDS